MKLALIRHGSTIGNIYGAYVGALEQPLCADGREKLEKNRHNGFYPDAKLVFTSPMLRCLQTVELIYPNHEPICEELLRERDFGEFEGLTHSEIILRHGYEHWGSTEDQMDFPGGESWEVFAKRSCEVFLKIVDYALKNDVSTVSVICHGGTIMAVMECFVDPQESRYTWQCDPGGGFLLDLDLETQNITLRQKICP